MIKKTNATKIRGLRQADNEAGPYQRGRICHLPSQPISEDQAQEWPQIKPLGSLLRVKAPALHAERDMLFDKYLQAHDNYNRWMNGSPVYTTNHGHDNRLTMESILRRHLDELSEQLQRYDDRINAARTTGPLYY